jgi:hypothetical protein
MNNNEEKEEKKMNDIQPGDWIVDDSLPHGTFIFAKLPEKDKISEVICYLYNTEYTAANARAIAAIPKILNFIEDAFLMLSFEQAKRRTKHGTYVILRARELLHEIKPTQYSSRNQTSDGRADRPAGDAGAGI